MRRFAAVPAETLCLKEIGYDALVLGNHEFNFDWNTMRGTYSWLKEGGVAVLAANAVWDGTDGAHTAGENVFTPYIVRTIRRPLPAVFVFYSSLICSIPWLSRVRT